MGISHKLNSPITPPSATICWWASSESLCNNFDSISSKWMVGPGGGMGTNDLSLKLYSTTLSGTCGFPAVSTRAISSLSSLNNHKIVLFNKKHINI